MDELADLRHRRALDASLARHPAGGAKRVPVLKFTLFDDGSIDIDALEDVSISDGTWLKGELGKAVDRMRRGEQGTRR